MSDLHHIVTAMIFLPPGLPYESTYARQCLQHVENHGYRLASIVRTWDQVLQALCADVAQVVVFARAEHFEPHWQPRVEFVGENTREIARNDRRPRLSAPPAGRRNQRPRVVGD